MLQVVNLVLSSNAYSETLELGCVPRKLQAMQAQHQRLTFHLQTSNLKHFDDLINRER